MMTRNREILRRLETMALFTALGLGMGAGAASAQSAIGVPFIGDNHLSFYSTELATDGIAKSTSTLYGGRYAHRFATTGSGSLSLGIRTAVRELGDDGSAIVDAGLTAAWSRRMAEVDERLSLTAAASADALVWGLDNTDTGLVHASIPVTLGAAWDLKVGAATLTPFVAPGFAYYDNRTYDDDVRTSRKTGWDARLTTGASLALKEVVLTTSRIRGEPGLPNRSRWAFAAGISF